MGVFTRLEEEEERLADRISNLPHDVHGDIVSLLPIKDGARTQLLSSHWRHVWCSAPLNLDLGIVASASHISGILSRHLGPVRRFVMPRYYTDFNYSYPPMANVDGWLRSPALDNLQELEFRHCCRLPALVQRFSSTLRVASFSDCSFPDGNNAGSGLRLPVLLHMTLLNVSISESSLQALLAGCPILESLLIGKLVHPRLQIVSPSLKSIGVHFSWKSSALVIKDAPCLERLLYFGGKQVDISVIYAPRLVIWGDLFHRRQRCYRVFQYDPTFFQGSMAVLPSVRVLSLCDVRLCSDAAINLVKCFPHLEILYIKAQKVWLKDVSTSYRKCQKLIATLDIRVKKIVLVNYEGSRSQINFVKPFISNSIVLESLRLELAAKNVCDGWIATQHERLHIEKRASRGARIAFVPRKKMIDPPDDLLGAEKVHDLSTDPFQSLHL